MTASQTTARFPDALPASSRAASSDGARLAAFDTASRHSRRVRFLKLSLPGSAVAIVLAFLAYSYWSMPGTVSFDLGTTGFSDGKLVMANPKLEGFTQDRRPFTMTAARALQDPKASDVVELEGIDARFPVDAENWATIGAKTGIFNRRKNTLDVADIITLTTTDGMKAVLQSAKMNITSGALSTTDPVDISLEGVRLTALSMNVLKNGAVLVFSKKVRMNIDPGRVKTVERETGDGNAEN